MKHRIFIDGQEGTTGLKILDRLNNREDIDLLIIDNENRKDLDARLDLISKSDISFLCLPDSASKELAELANVHNRIIDTSTAHRVHPNWTYGMPELCKGQRGRIAKANRVAVPGCHATGFILMVKPLRECGIISKDYPLTCHSITGYSGGGKKMIHQYQEDAREKELLSPRQYGLGQNHKHLAEMSLFSDLEGPPVFSPIVADFYSGMLVSTSLHSKLLDLPIGVSELRNIYSHYYEGEEMVEVLEENPEDGIIAANKLSGFDNLQIFVLGNDDRISICARYDNLGKGASGTAIQCMNIMLGLPEETGLCIKR